MQVGDSALARSTTSGDAVSDEVGKTPSVERAVSVSEIRDTLVVLHGGWGAEHGYLLDAFAGLGDRYHLVFYDQRGSLRSACPDSAVAVDAHVADLDRLRGQLDLERLHLVAHSMGTRLALEYLASHLDRVGGMILMGAVNPRPFDRARDSAIAAGSMADDFDATDDLAAHQLWLDRPDAFPEVLDDAVAEVVECSLPGGDP